LPPARRQRRQHSDAASRSGGTALMIAPPLGVHVWLACGIIDMRKGFDGLASLAEQQRLIGGR